MRYIDEMDLKGKKCTLPVRFQCAARRRPQYRRRHEDQGGAATINYALDENARVIIASHLGRPKGNGWSG